MLTPDQQAALVSAGEHEAEAAIDAELSRLIKPHLQLKVDLLAILRDGLARCAHAVVTIDLAPGQPAKVQRQVTAYHPVSKKKSA